MALNAVQKDGFHTAIAGIALSTAESVALHERLRFEKVARFKQVGFKLDRWVDIGYWQRILNAGGHHFRAD
jgi:L-amino acid N-acyltransferase YncA